MDRSEPYASIQTAVAASFDGSERESTGAMQQSYLAMLMEEIEAREKPAERPGPLVAPPPILPVTVPQPSGATPRAPARAAERRERPRYDFD